jgi:nucleotidyltransferase substrate binding protein (TIGR01987 family)
MSPEHPPKYNLLLRDFENALQRLKEAVSQIDNELVIDATIQRFEFTYELAWKTLKSWLLQKGVALNTPRDVLKSGFQENLITNEELWLRMIEARNLTSHTYREDTAEDVYEKMMDYIDGFEELLENLKERKIA